MSEGQFLRPAADETIISADVTDIAEARSASARIFWFAKEHLVQLAVGDGGWSKLYLDPLTRILWELTYPSGAKHGGGAPQLAVIQEPDAVMKYGEWKQRN